MDPSSPTGRLKLFRETRASIAPPLGSIIQIHVSSTGTFTARQRHHRRILRQNQVCDSQEAYSKHYLARSSSVFHGKSAGYPRHFLWRIVNDQRVLELRSVDLSKSQEEEREAIYTIQLCFDAQLNCRGVALADDDENPNILTVFALTQANEVYTLSIRKDFFCTAGASEEDVNKWCRIIRPATFSISLPFCLVASSPAQFIVPLVDGRLLRMTAEKIKNETAWHETVHGDGQWTSSLKSLVRWQGSNTVKHNGTALDQNTSVAVQASPDGKHIFSVCLNHTLKIWDPDIAAAVFTKDLLWADRDQHDIAKVMLDPAQPNLLQVFKPSGVIDGDLYYAVTYSPQDTGRFKFWAIRDSNHGESGVRDLFPDDILKSPDPDPNPASQAIWRLMDYRVRTVEESRQISVWLVFKSGSRYKLFALSSELDTLPEAWNDQWLSTIVHDDQHHQKYQHISSGQDDVSQAWLSHIFSPGRYPNVLLESVLSAYRTARKMAAQSPRLPLQERLEATISNRVDSRHPKATETQRREALHHEWTVFSQDIQDFDRARFNILAISLDHENDLPWLLFADGCSIIRSCSKLETTSSNDYDILAHSQEHLELPSIELAGDAEPKLPDELAVILKAASDLRMSMLHGIGESLEAGLTTKLWEEHPAKSSDVMRAIYEEWAIDEDTAEALFEGLEKNLEPVNGPRALDSDAFSAILDTLNHIQHDAPTSLDFTKFGVRFLVAAARDMIDDRERILLDLLCLAIFIENEVDQSQTPMDYFKGPETYKAIVSYLRTYKILQWLANHTVSSPVSVNGNKTEQRSGPTQQSQTNDDPTVLEAIFAVDLQPQMTEHCSGPELLTQNIQDLLQWAIGGNGNVSLDEVLVHIQCHLLKIGCLELATDFARFQPATPWAIYIDGRLSLLQGKPEEATRYFRKAASSLSRSSKFEYLEASGQFLTRHEASQLGHGELRYYSHIIELLTNSDPQCPAQAVAIAQQALKLHNPNTPLNDQASTILKSLFNSALQIQDIPVAFSAFTRHPDSSSLLPDLISTLLATPALRSNLLSLPWPTNLHPQIATLLSQQTKDRKILAAWYLHHQDFRSAASALLPSLQASQHHVRKGQTSTKDQDNLQHDYLTVINLLACAGKENAWVLSGGSDGNADDHATNGMTDNQLPRRRIVTLQDLRSDYQDELDRRNMIDGGRFAFGMIE